MRRILLPLLFMTELLVATVAWRQAPPFVVRTIDWDDRGRRQMFNGPEKIAVAIDAGGATCVLTKAEEIEVPTDFLSRAPARDAEGERLGIPFQQGPTVRGLRLARFGPGGVELWRYEIPGFHGNPYFGSTLYSYSLSAGGDGSIWATVTLQGGALVEGRPMGRFTGTAHYSALLLRFDTTGRLLWSREYAGGPNPAEAQVQVDAAGNALFSMRFSGRLEFEGESLLASSTGTLIASLDPTGDLRWVRSFDGLNHAWGIARMPDGGAAVMGWFHDRGNFGEIPLQRSARPGRGHPNVSQGVMTGRGDIGPNVVFVARLDRSGKTMWLKQIEGTSQRYGGIDPSSIAVDSSGAILALCYGSGETFIGDVVVDEPDDESLTSDHAFVIRFSPEGKVLATNRTVGSGHVVPYGLEVSPMGGVVLVGTLIGEVTLAEGPEPDISSVMPEESCAVAIALDHDLEYRWHVTAGPGLPGKEQFAAGATGATDVVVDARGTVIIAGAYRGPALFEGRSFGRDGYGMFLLRSDDRKEKNRF